MLQALSRFLNFTTLQRIFTAVSTAVKVADSAVNVIRLVAPMTATKADDNFVEKYDASKAHVEKNLQNALAYAERLKNLKIADEKIVEKVIYLLQKTFQSEKAGQMLSDEALKLLEEKVRAKISG
ncbi:MAG: hypothetical protein AB1403_21295 [Candidatus Riflebacteria bacterium]